MKRRRLLITGVLLLLGGAIVNVAVAWGLSLIDLQRQPARFPESSIETVSGLFGQLPPRPQFIVGFQEFLLGRYAFGFPIRSMEYYTRQASATQYAGGVWVHGEYLPLRVSWPGFAINTIFYAAMLWVVFFVPGMVRRRIRRRRGLCPACAYPIGTSPVCTECGTHVVCHQNMQHASAHIRLKGNSQ